MQKNKLDYWGGGGGGGGGEAPKKTFSISYILNSSNRVFNPYFNQYLSNVKSPFAGDSRAERNTFSAEKISLSLKLLAGHFYGHSCIKTV